MVDGTEGASIGEMTPGAGRDAGSNREKRVVDAAMRLAAERGWRDLGLADVAEAAGLSLAEAYAVLPSKSAILGLLSARTDEAVLDGWEAAGEGESRRDRLFDLLMRRFDALAPYRDGLRVILREAPSDPLSVLASGPRLIRAMSWMLEAVGIPTGGLRGAARVNALAFIYLAVSRTWIDDDSPDLSRTMAALDRALNRAERVLG